MGDYATAAAAVSGSPLPAKSLHLCCVDGCQMPGTLSSDTTGSAEWYCRLHFGSRYGDRGLITNMAANRAELYRIAWWCINRSPNEAVPNRLTAKLQQMGRADLLDAKPAVEGRTLTVCTLGHYMLSVLDQECLGRQKHRQEQLVPEGGEQARQSWHDLRQIAEQWKRRAQDDEVTA